MLSTKLPPLKSPDKAMLTDGFADTKKKSAKKAAKELPPLSEQTKKTPLKKEKNVTSPKKSKSKPKESSKSGTKESVLPPITAINRCTPPEPSRSPPLETPTPDLPDADVDPVKKFDVPKKSKGKKGDNREPGSQSRQKSEMKSPRKPAGRPTQAKKSPAVSQRPRPHISMQI